MNRDLQSGDIGEITINNIVYQYPVYIDRNTGQIFLYFVDHRDQTNRGYQVIQLGNTYQILGLAQPHEIKFRQNPTIESTEIVRLSKQIQPPDFYSTLPDELILEISKNLSFQEIRKQCLISQRFNSLLCKSQSSLATNFWKTYIPSKYPELVEWKLDRFDYLIEYEKRISGNVRPSRSLVFPGKIGDRAGLPLQEITFVDPFTKYPEYEILGRGCQKINVYVEKIYSREATFHSFNFENGILVRVKKIEYYPTVEGEGFKFAIRIPSLTPDKSGSLVFKQYFSDGRFIQTQTVGFMSDVDPVFSVTLIDGKLKAGHCFSINSDKGIDCHGNFGGQIIGFNPKSINLKPLIDWLFVSESDHVGWANRWFGEQPWIKWGISDTVIKFDNESKPNLPSHMKKDGWTPLGISSGL